MNAALFFGGAPEASGSAPGRVNLPGEHADSNDGYMLPVATPQRTEVALSRSNDGHFHFYSATLGNHVTFAHGSSTPPGFGSYAEGCIRLVQARGVDALPEQMRRRGRHVVSDDLCVLEAIEAIDGVRFGELINLCHFSLGDDDVSIPARAACAQQSPHGTKGRILMPAPHPEKGNHE